MGDKRVAAEIHVGVVVVESEVCQGCGCCVLHAADNKLWDTDLSIALKGVGIIQVVAEKPDYVSGFVERVFHQFSKAFRHIVFEADAVDHLLIFVEHSCHKADEICWMRLIHLPVKSGCAVGVVSPV
ncbi:hypothetical protein HRbin03_00364 [archaeon HR03]|nr:hypothetical protein HRbin03_00364 [archaeon HR03]